MILLYTEGYESLKKFIFDLYDFDNDAKISPEDVKVVLSYIPLKINQNCHKESDMNLEREEYTDRIESQDELQDLLKKCFGENKDLNYQEFSAIIENVSSEIFLFMIFFLFQKRPFSKKSVDEYVSKENKDSSSSRIYNKTPNTIYRTKNFITSPNLNSKFSPSVTISKSPFWRMKKNKGLTSLKLDQNITNSKHTDFLNKLGIIQNTHSNSLNTLLKYSKLCPTIKAEEKNSVNLETMDSERSQNGDYENQVEENVNKISIPVFDKNLNNLNRLDKKEYTSKIFENVDIEPAVKFVLGPCLKNMENLDSTKKIPTFTYNSIVDESDEDLEDLHHEGYLYRISSKGSLKKIYFKLIQRDLYNYANATDIYHKGLINLCGVFIQEDGKLYLNGKTYFSFVLIFNLKKRVYYSDNQEEYEKWVSIIKLVTGYKDLNETYSVKEKLGNGRFGLVRFAIQNSTGRQVAIKIMFKLNMTLQDLQMIRTEIEVLKVCQHPNIIKIYDVYENANYFYISKNF